MDRRLGGTVDWRRRQRHESECRRYVDDGALVSRKDVDERGGRADYTPHVDVHLSHQSVEVGRRNLEVLVEHDACVVHENVELWEFSFHARRERGYLRWLRDVA